MKPDKAGLSEAWIRETADPWSDIHVDFYGPLNRTPSPGNYRSILTCICASCRSPRFLPTRDDSAKEAARVPLDLFCQESFPSKLTSDRGSAFVSEIIQTLSSMIGMRLAMTVSNRAKSNGLAERPHRFLRSCLSILGNPSKTDWNELCPIICLTYRSCVHPALGETPFFLERGRDPRMPQELMTPALPREKKSTTEFRRTMLMRLKKAKDIAEKLDAKTKARQTEYYNRSRLPERVFEPGDLVWIWREPPASTEPDPTRRTRKLEFKASGAWRVLEHTSKLTYRLRHARTGAEDTFNVDCMCPVKITEFTNPDDLIAIASDGPTADEAQEFQFDGPYASEDDRRRRR